MPRINRIRIINFSYNNDLRHIQDEIFNFHGGENALLSLANGGGKSVLVQLIFQPIVPETRIQGRRINDFFRKKRLPAYVLIEWKLDGAGGYLLTGLGMVSAEASGVEDEKNRIRYFTFTHQYMGANGFDLSHLELVKQKGNILEIMPFKEAREMLLEKEKKDPYLFGCFYDDDGERYRRRLAEFGIAQDEWKNIIAKINDSEGGLDEIFQKYKNSSQLLNEWVIKTIEKVIYKDRSEAHRLEDMLEGLVREVAENERFILEKQVLDEFLVGYGEQVEALLKLLNGLEEQHVRAENLAALDQYVQVESERLQEVRGGNDQEAGAIKKELLRIDLEERSYAYWQRREELELASGKLAVADEISRESEGQLELAKYTVKTQQAAGLREEIARKRAELAGFSEKLAQARSEQDTDERMQSLEYSLKLTAGEILVKLESELSRLNAEQEELKSSLQQVKEDGARLDRDLRSLEGEKGSLQQQVQEFASKEKEIRDRLGLKLSRNLLGELAEKEIARAKQELQRSLEDRRQQVLQLESEKVRLQERQNATEGDMQDLRDEQATMRNQLQDLERLLAEYEEKEQEIQRILHRFGFDSELRFDRERLNTLFNQQSKKIDLSLEEALRLRDEAAEALMSLKNGRLHVPEKIIAMLAVKDIPFDTGETYLRNQAPAIREKLLELSPVLPYSLILAKEHLVLLAPHCSGLKLRQVLPLIAYEDLAKGFAPLAQGLVQASDGLSLLCLYEGRVFDSEGLSQLEAELKLKQQEAAEQQAHYRAERTETAAQQAICGRFAYPADHSYRLEKEKSAAMKKLGEIQEKTESLERERSNLRQALSGNETAIAAAKKDFQGSESALTGFETWMEQEPRYQACRRRLEEVSETIGSADKKQAALAAQQERLREESRAVDGESDRKKREAGGIRKKLVFYQDAIEAERAEGTLEELENRLQALKADYSGVIELLENQKKGLLADCAQKERELRKLGLTAEEYEEVSYDELLLEEISGKIEQYEKMLRKAHRDTTEAAVAKGKAEQALDIAVEEVRKLGADSPLNPEEVRGDFPGRRQQSSTRLSRLIRDNEEINSLIAEYRKLLEHIGPLLKDMKVEPASGFRPEADLKGQTVDLVDSYRQLSTGNRNQTLILRNGYNTLRAHYRERNTNLNNIFKGLDLLWEKADMAYEEFFYLYERMGQHQSILLDLIKLHENQLSNLERNKKDMVQQSLLQGMRFYEEIEWISEHSKVRLQGKSRSVQMLKIELSLDSVEAAGQRMKDYIEECIRKVREETRQEKSGDEVRKTVAKLMYSRELLNVYLGHSQIPVKVFKIDLNMQNSALKLWEDAVRENSGGEKFVVYFAVLSALMAYTRSRSLEAAGAREEKDSSVLLMDNPFGPISSEHLLNPLFEIAKKHRTQLICLSDLKQNSIMNCFNLIYMLKIRSSAVGSNEYLKFEEHIRDQNGVQDDERLEKAVFRASEHKQFTLFEE